MQERYPALPRLKAVEDVLQLWLLKCSALDYDLRESEYSIDQGEDQGKQKKVVVFDDDFLAVEVIVPD